MVRGCITIRCITPCLQQQVTESKEDDFKGPSTLATLLNHMWPRIVAGIFIPVGNRYFQALASTLQFVAQVCDRLWLVPATDRAFAYITYMSPPHVALVCSGPPQWLNKVASVHGPLQRCFYAHNSNKNNRSGRVGG